MLSSSAWLLQSSWEATGNQIGHPWKFQNQNDIVINHHHYCCQDNHRNRQSHWSSLNCFRIKIILTTIIMIIVIRIIIARGNNIGYHWIFLSENNIVKNFILNIIIIMIIAIIVRGNGQSHWSSLSICLSITLSISLSSS